MNGEFEVTSLKGLLNVSSLHSCEFSWRFTPRRWQLWLDNRKGLTAIETSISGAFSRYSALAINALGRQSLQVAKWNVVRGHSLESSLKTLLMDNRMCSGSRIQHVEHVLPGVLSWTSHVLHSLTCSTFQTFLSKEMMYSCALWSDAEHGVRGDLTVGPTEGDLEAAQLRKIHTIIKKARLRSGDRLLEIGSGWGAMSIEVKWQNLYLSAHVSCTLPGGSSWVHRGHSDAVLRTEGDDRRASEGCWSRRPRPGSSLRLSRPPRLIREYV